MQGNTIKTKCTIYAGRQKQQRINLHKLPPGSIGVIRHSETDNEYGIESHLVRFRIGNQDFYAKLATSTFETIEISNKKR